MFSHKQVFFKVHFVLRHIEFLFSESHLLYSDLRYLSTTFRSVLNTSFLKPRFLIYFHICSIGLIPGVYGGIKIIFNEADLCQAAPSHTNMILSRGNVINNSYQNTFIHSVLQYGITRKQLSPVNGSMPHTHICILLYDDSKVSGSDYKLYIVYIYILYYSA